MSGVVGVSNFSGGKYVRWVLLQFLLFVNRGQKRSEMISWKKWRTMCNTKYFTIIFLPLMFFLITALLSALILVVFAHLKLIMKCMHWAKQAINQSRCVSRWVPDWVSGAQQPDGSNYRLVLAGRRSPRPSPTAVIAKVCAGRPYYN